MGRLVTLNELAAGLGLNWYFADFNKHREPVLPCEAFAHVVAIRDNVIRDDSVLKVNIRNFVAETCADLTIFVQKYDTYFHYSNTHRSRWDWDGYQVSWGYNLFYFQSNSEAVMFKLKFSEFVSDKILPYDPDRPPKQVQEAQYEAEEAQRKLEAAKKEAVSKADKMSNIQKKYQEYIEQKSKSEWEKNDNDYDDDYWDEVKKEFLDDVDFDDEDDYIKALDNIYSQPVKPILNGSPSINKAKSASAVLAQIQKRLR